MASRKSTHPVQPFPTEMSRHDFGHFVAGFSAGEGTFILRQDWRDDIKCWVSFGAFEITLRLDDLEMLELMQSYLQCGTITIRMRTHKDMPNAKPVAAWRVHHLQELATKIVPHFDKFPLIAKKKRDFAIWREAILLSYSVKCRKRQFLKVGKGTLPKWTTQEIEYFGSLVKSLKEQRAYQSPIIPLPPTVIPPKPPGLFKNI